MTPILETNGAFATFPVISVTHNEGTNERVVDRFNINVVAENVVGVTGVDANTKAQTEDGKSVVYFRADTGLRPIVSTAEPKELMEVIQAACWWEFVGFNVVSAVDDKNTGEQQIEHYVGYANVEEIVGVNTLDETAQQVSSDTRSIIYFKPQSGLRPTLSSDDYMDLVAKINEYMG